MGLASYSVFHATNYHFAHVIGTTKLLGVMEPFGTFFANSCVFVTLRARLAVAMFSSYTALQNVLSVLVFLV